MTSLSRAIGVLALLAAIAAVAADAAGLPLRQVTRLSLPGPAVRFDYASIDPRLHRLYIAHMDASDLLVFDLHTRRVIRTVHAPGVHGVLAVPQLQRVFASATDDHELLTLDARSGRVLRRAPAGSYPDGIAYDPVERHVFVSDESGGIEAIFDRQGRRVATVHLGGEAGNVQYDGGSGRILADVQTRNAIAVIDPRTNRIVRRISTPGCSHPHGLLLDVPHRFGFVACDGNATLLTLDLRRLRFVGNAGVGDSPDVLAIDPGLRRLYVAAESGEVAVFAEQQHALAKLGQRYLAPEAHSVAVDPSSHLVYFPLQGDAHHGPELLIMAPAG